MSCFNNVIHNVISLSIDKRILIWFGLIFVARCMLADPKEKFICQHDTVQSLLAKSSQILLFICCIMLRPSKEKEEPLKESAQNSRKTKRVKNISTADNGSRFPKLAYLTVEEFEEIPK